MLITKVSGATVTEIDEDQLHQMMEEGHWVEDLKRYLSAQVGFSRFRIKLLAEDRELQDDMPLQPWSNLQLVILDFLPHDPVLDPPFCSTDWRCDVEEMLARPHDPNTMFDPDRFFNPNVFDMGPIETLELLLEAGISKEVLNQRNREGLCPLLQAALYGQEDWVQLLLVEGGANVDAIRPDGRTALHMASLNGYDKVVRCLIQARANTNVEDNGGWTALHVATEYDYLETARVLCEAGADKDATFEGGISTVFWAAWSFAHDVLQYLIEIRADINAADADDMTPLHVAARQGDLDAARYLVEAGANKNAKSADGMTPFDLAIAKDHSELVPLLVARDEVCAGVKGRRLKRRRQR